jgi:hypothetical protein
VDGDGVTTFLGSWILAPPAPGAASDRDRRHHHRGSRCRRPAGARGDDGRAGDRVSRRDPRRHRLADALRAAGCADRLAIVARTPPAFATPTGLHLACAGTTQDHAAALVAACRGKAAVPEPLRLAHLIARAITDGESRGRA